MDGVESYFSAHLDNVLKNGVMRMGDADIPVEVIWCDDESYLARDGDGLYHIKAAEGLWSMAGVSLTNESEGNYWRSVAVPTIERVGVMHPVSAEAITRAIAQIPEARESFANG